MGGDQAEDDEDLAVEVGGAGGAGGRVVVDAGALDARPAAWRRGIVEGEGQALGPGDQRPDRLDDQPRGDAVGLLAGGGDGGISGWTWFPIIRS